MATKSKVRGKAAAGDMIANPKALLLAQIKQQQFAKALRVRPLSDAIVIERWRGRDGPPASAKLVMELSAQDPFHDHGLIDGYSIGRWDTSTDHIYMDPFVNGPSIGEWTGSVLYGRFKAPEAGAFLVVVHFYGYQITMGLHGPWGTMNAASVENVPNFVSAQWTGAAGASMWFNIICSGLYLGFVQKIKVFKL